MADQQHPCRFSETTAQLSAQTPHGAGPAAESEAREVPVAQETETRPQRVRLQFLS